MRERLAKVEEWKARRSEIEEELERVWVEGGDELSPPPYAETVDVGSEEGESVVSESSPLSRTEGGDGDAEEHGAQEGGDAQSEGLFSSTSSWNPALRPS